MSDNMGSNTWRAKLTERGATFGKGATEVQVAAAEKAMGITLPSGYRGFVLEVGWAEIETEYGLLSIAGLGRDAPDDLNLTAIVAEARSAGVDAHLLPIADEGDFLFLDTQSAEGAVLYLEDGETRELAGSFSAWLSEELSD